MIPMGMSDSAFRCVCILTHQFVKFHVKVKVIGMGHAALIAEQKKQ